MARQTVDGVEVEITAEMAAFLAAMNRMAAAAEASAARIQRAFANANVRIERQGAPGIEPLQQLDVQLERTATNAENAGKRMERSFGGFGFGSGLQGIAIQMAGFAAIMGTVGLAAKSLEAMGGFERSIAMLGAVTESTAEKIAPLRKQAMELGASTSRSADDVAKLQVELGKLGWSIDRIQSSTPGILNLSIAGDMEAGEAAKLVGSTIQQFKLNAADAQDIADTLAQAAIKSAADVRDFGTSLDYVGGIAAQYKMSLKDTVAILMTLADAGFNPSMAATGARSLIFDFTTPSMHAREFFKQLKFDVRDATGQVKPLVQLIDEFNVALEKKGLNVNTLPYGIIDTNSSAALAAILQQSTDKVRAHRASLDENADAAKRLSSVYMEGLKGSLDLLSGAWETFSVKLGDAGVLTGATNAVDGLIRALEGMTSWVETDGAAIFGVGGFFDGANTILDGLFSGRSFSQLGAFLSGAPKEALGDLRTVGERHADEAKARKAAEERQAAANAAADRISRVPIVDGMRSFAVPFTDPSTERTAPKLKPKPPGDPLAALMGGESTVAQMRRETREMQELAAAAQQGSLAYEQANRRIQRANIVRTEGAAAGAAFDQRNKAQSDLSDQLERLRTLQDEVEAYRLEESRFATQQHAQMMQALQDEVDEYFSLTSAKADVASQTARAVEDEQAIAAAAAKGAAAYERMRVARDMMRQAPLMTEDEANAMANAIVGAQERTARAVDEMNRLRDAAMSVGDAFAGTLERAILEGGKLKDLLRSLAADILAIAVRTAITAPIGMAIGSAFAGMFGVPVVGARAVGGPVKPGGAYRVGEAGPELFIPDTPGKIIAAHKLGGEGGAVAITYAPVIDARGADAAAVARIEEAMRRDRASRVAEVRAIVADGMRRRVIK